MNSMRSSVFKVSHLQWGHGQVHPLPSILLYDAPSRQHEVCRALPCRARWPCQPLWPWYALVSRLVSDGVFTSHSEILRLPTRGSWPHERLAAWGGDGALATVGPGEHGAGSFRLQWRKWEAPHPLPDLCWVSRTDLAPCGPPSRVLADAPTAGHAVCTLGSMGRGAAQPFKGHTVIYNIPHWFHLWGITGEDET